MKKRFIKLKTLFKLGKLETAQQIAELCSLEALLSKQEKELTCSCCRVRKVWVADYIEGDENEVLCQNCEQANQDPEYHKRG